MPKAPKAHILLIEDDPFLSHIYKTKFEQEGFQITLAVNGEEGLEEAARRRPDVILLDLLIPKVDGFTVLGKLKEHQETAQIPVLVLTNLAQKDDVDRCMSLGATDYLIKAHFKPAETVEKVKAILSG